MQMVLELVKNLAFVSRKSERRRCTRGFTTQDII